MQIGGARAVSVIATPRCPLEPDSRHQPGRGFAQGKDARADRRHGETIEDQRRGAVGKPFGFQDDKARMRQGISMPRAMARGATASGGEMIAPNKKPMGQSKRMSL